MQTATISLLALLLYSSTFVAVNCQGSCASCNCQLNNVQSLRLLVETVVNETMEARLPNAVNQTVASRFQNIQSQVNASIDERIEISQRDVPGKPF